METHQDLVSLDLSLPVGCDISLLRSFACHPRLRELRLHSLFIPQLELQNLRGFPSLEACTVSGAHESIAHFLGCISPPTVRRLSIETYSTIPASILLQHVTHFADLTHLLIERSAVRCSWDHFAPMLFCSRIQTLRITNLWTTTLFDDRSVEALARSLVNLTELVLRVCEECNQVTLRGLEAFAKHCPNLHSLTIPVNAHRNEDIFPIPTQHSSTSLTKLNLELSTIGDDTMSVAQAITSMFPNLREGWSSHSEMVKWRTMWEAVRVAQLPEGEDGEMNTISEDYYQAFRWGMAHFVGGVTYTIQVSGRP
ncbi:hypothetical protein FRB99_007238 [Tulasnella sp. 403]|nr:hypothetical protein FRB99_007238 [Tulasnella sp. 403]